jgi:hypothetical protein
MANHLDVVIAVKAELEARGVSLTGACGAFAITQRVAWRLRGEHYGLLVKTSGTQCAGFATDILCLPTGDCVDILADAGGENRPTWQEKPHEVDPSRYAPAFDPADRADRPPPPLPPAAPPPAPPHVLDVDLQKLLDAGDRIVDGCTQIAAAVTALSARLDKIETDGVRLRLR